MARLSKKKPLNKEKQLNKERFRASAVWLHAWKISHNISFNEVSGESRSITPEMTSTWNETSPYQDTRWRTYTTPMNSVFYQGRPKKTLHMKGKKWSGGEHSKVPLTGMIAASVARDKLPMFVNGKSAQPRCFKNVKTLPCRYQLQEKSWMDSFLLDKWVKELDKKFKKENRKSCSNVDNCPAHPIIKGLKAAELVFLPPNATSQR